MLEHPSSPQAGKSISGEGKTSGPGDDLPVSHGALQARPASADQNSGLSPPLPEKKTTGRGKNYAVAHGLKSVAHAPGENLENPRTFDQSWPSSRTNKEVPRASGKWLEFGGQKSSRDTVGCRRRPLRSENASSSEQRHSWVSRPTRPLVFKIEHPFLVHTPAAV